MPKLFNSLFVAAALIFEKMMLAGLAATPADCHMLGGAPRTEQHTEKAAAYWIQGLQVCHRLTAEDLARLHFVVFLKSKRTFNNVEHTNGAAEYTAPWVRLGGHSDSSALGLYITIQSQQDFVRGTCITQCIAFRYAEQ